MMPEDQAVWQLAHEMRDLVRTEEAYRCAEKHLRLAWNAAIDEACVALLAYEGRPMTERSINIVSSLRKP